MGSWFWPPQEFIRALSTWGGQNVVNRILYEKILSSPKSWGSESGSRCMVLKLISFLLHLSITITSWKLIIVITTSIIFKQILIDAEFQISNAKTNRFLLLNSMTIQIDFQLLQTLLYLFIKTTFENCWINLFQILYNFENHSVWRQCRNRVGIPQNCTVFEKFILDVFWWQCLSGSSVFLFLPSLKPFSQKESN